MSSILKIKKKILKPVAIVIARIFVWVIIFTNHHLCRSNKNYLPVLLASLCFNDLLVFKIDPKILKRHIRDPDILRDDLFIWSGEWDKDLISIEEHEKFIVMKELFVYKKESKDTQFYNYAINKMNMGNPIQRGNLMLDSIENINRYFKKNRTLFKDIKNKGFKLNLAPEIGVVIDRKGDLIHYRQGHHTLAIAKILNEKEVIVRIRAIHNIWIESKIKGIKISLLNSLYTDFKNLQKNLSLLSKM